MHATPPTGGQSPRRRLRKMGDSASQTTIPVEPVADDFIQRPSIRPPVLDDPSPTSAANPTIISQTQTIDSESTTDSLATIAAVPNVVADAVITSRTKDQGRSKRKVDTLQKNRKAVLNNDILTFSRPSIFDREEVDVDPIDFMNFINASLAK